MTIAGTLKVGGRTVTLTVTRTLAAGVTGTFTLPLTNAAKRALAGSGGAACGYVRRCGRLAAP